MMRDWLVAPPAGSTRAPTLRKADLIETLCGRGGLTRQEADEMVEGFFEVVRDTLAAGEAVKLSGFGSFRLRDKPPRPGRNPQTGVATLIEARRVVTFHPGPTFRARLGRG